MSLREEDYYAEFIKKISLSELNQAFISEKKLSTDFTLNSVDTVFFSPIENQLDIPEGIDDYDNN